MHGRLNVFIDRFIQHYAPGELVQLLKDTEPRRLYSKLRVLPRDIVRPFLVTLYALHYAGL
eukprot:2488725-Lingulodinium_polyedra.AAC.1